MANACFWKRKSVIKRSNCISCSGYDKFCSDYSESSYRERMMQMQQAKVQEEQKQEQKQEQQEQTPRKRWWSV